MPETRRARTGGTAPTAAAELAGDGGQDAAAVPGGSDAPVLRLGGYEGPLDALLHEARAGRVDLRRLPVLALVEQCVTALEGALRALRVAAAAAGDARDRDGGGGGPSTPAPPSLQRLAEWVGMAAWLAWLRTRLLLPEHDPQARAAREEAEAFRRGLARRAAAQEAADWLDAQPQLGRDVFAHGAAVEGVREAAERAAAELDALLLAYARRIDSATPAQGRATGATYRPQPPHLWRVPDAVRRIERLLGDTPDPEAGDAGGTDLWRFLPDAEDLVPAAGSDPALLGRSAAASTFAAALELARLGRLALAQDRAFAPVAVRERHDGAVPPPDPDSGAVLVEAPASG